MIPYTFYSKSVLTHHIPLFLRDCCPEDPDSEDSVVIVVTLLLALLLDLKDNPLLALLYD